MDNTEREIEKIMADKAVEDAIEANQNLALTLGVFKNSLAEQGITGDLADMLIIQHHQMIFAAVFGSSIVQKLQGHPEND